MEFSEFLALARADLQREIGRSSNTLIFKRLLRRKPTYSYVFWMRLTHYFKLHPVYRFTLYFPAAAILRHKRYKYGISIPRDTRIGPGLRILHTGGIVVQRRTVIGRNCLISQGVTLGQIYRGAHAGAPVIGDDVFVGPGAKVIGGVVVGNNVMIGANAVVTRDVPDDAVVAGVPARVISYRGANDCLPPSPG